MSLITEVQEELISILQKKEEDLLTTDPSLVDYPILSEEIEDAKYAISSIKDELPEMEMSTRLLHVLHGTTSGRIYDSLGRLFPTQHVSEKVPLDIL